MFVILFGISVVYVKRTVPSDFGNITHSWIGNAVFAYQCPTQHISSQHPWLAARNRSTWLLHPNLEGTEITPDFQGVSCCLVICTCVKFVRHNSSRNSVLVLGRLFCFIFFGFAQVSLTLVKLKDGEQRRLWSTSAALCQTPSWCQTPTLWLLWAADTFNEKYSKFWQRKKRSMNVGFLPTRDSLNQQWERARYQRVCWSKFLLPGQDLLSLLAIRGRKK